MVDGVTSMLAMHTGYRAGGIWNLARGSNPVDGGAPYYTTYRTKDGFYMAVGPVEQRFYTIMIDRLGLAIDTLPSRDDPACWPALWQILQDRFATRTRDEFFPGYRADAVTVGVRGHWTLWAGGRTAAKIHEADAALDGSEAREREMRQAVDGAVIDAWSGFHTAQRMVEATLLRVAATSEALRSTKLEAKMGEKPTLAVLDAEREAMAAQAAEIDAEGRRLVAAWQLNALTGNVTP